VKCEICGTELRAEPAITEPGWIIFHECIIRGDTEQEVIDNYEKIRVSAHNSDYAKCSHVIGLICGVLDITISECDELNLHEIYHKIVEIKNVVKELSQHFA